MPPMAVEKSFLAVVSPKLLSISELHPFARFYVPCVSFLAFEKTTGQIHIGKKLTVLETFVSFPVLFLSVFVFVSTAAWVFSDRRRLLIPSVRLYHPSFLYAYLALTLQGGVVQVIQRKNI